MNTQTFVDVFFCVLAVSWVVGMLLTLHISSAKDRNE
jgi:hypothetical protein